MDSASRDLHHQISRYLVDWFHSNRRDFPWRKNYEPYSIWIAEMMLQQTQAERVVPYYLKWIKRFPTTESITKSSCNDLYRLWEGLGYYTRVQYIYKTAQIIQSDYGNQFPTRHSDLLRLPGIGPYTAGAIMSIACS